LWGRHRGVARGRMEWRAREEAPPDGFLLSVPVRGVEPL
jgi:hypothetical protein